MTGRVAAVCVAQPGTLRWRGKELRSAIFKQPVDGPVALGVRGFVGDAQADDEHHGGLDMAVCVYPGEHVAEWERRLGAPLRPGAFGENLRTEGLLETEVCIGDTLAIGGAVVQVSQPRGPCYKLAARHGRRELPAWLARELKAGFLVRVLEPGPVAAGDAIELVERHSEVTVAEVLRVLFVDRRDDEAIAAVREVPELAAQTRRSLDIIARRDGVVANEFGLD